MYLSTTLLSLSTTLSLAASIPHRPLRRAVPAIPNNTTFDILLAGTMNDAMGTLSESVDVMILDLEGNDASTIADLKSQGHTVLCYFSAGTYEPGRAASGQFKDGDMGNYMKDWPDERWLNVDSENVRNIMKGRMQMAQEKGCVGVDLDNVDGYVSFFFLLLPLVDHFLWIVSSSFVRSYAPSILKSPKSNKTKTKKTSRTPN